MAGGGGGGAASVQMGSSAREGGEGCAGRVVSVSVPDEVGRRPWPARSEVVVWVWIGLDCLAAIGR